MDGQKAAEERIRQPTLASLFESLQLFSAHLGPDDLGRRILEVVAQATRSSRASLMLLGEGEGALTIKASIGLPPEVVATAQARLGEGVAGWVAQNRCPLLLPDGAEIPASIRETLVREEITSALSVPLEVEGRLLGVLNLARKGDSLPFTSPDLWFASLLADRLAAALHSAQLYSQLRARERFITRTLESIPSSLLVIDRTQRIVLANRNFLEKSRRTERATLGHKLEEVFPPTLIKYTHLDGKVEEVFHTGESIEGGKLTYRAPGLPSRIYYYRLLPLKERGEVENVLLFMDDVTERERLGEEVRRAEQHLASVVECANDMVVSLDSEGRILTWNRAAEGISGLAAERVRGQAMLSLCASDHRPTMAEVLKKLSHGGGIQIFEMNLLTTNGQEVPIAWSFSPMHSDSGEVAGIVAVGRDLTERRRLEAPLIQSAKMASLGVMAGGIAHELRNPLAITSAASQLLEEHPEDVKLRAECVKKIRTSTQRASAIIENLLKFARPKSTRMVELDVQTVMEETLALLSHQMALQKVELKKESRPYLPKIRGNAELLGQVFTNLILNAVTAMPKGGSLTVATWAVDSNEVAISIKDTGIGIPPENLTQIFDPFFTTMPVGKGTGLGLGLSIAYSIIREHQGTIGVESQVGQGSNFTIRLPAIKPAPQPRT